MAYELTINRTVAFFETANVTPPGKELMRLSDLMAEGDFEPAYSAAMTTASKMDTVIQSIPRPPDAEYIKYRPGVDFTAHRNPDDDKATIKHLAVLFERRYFTVKTENQLWEVRIRPTITFPSPGNSGLTHLWWTTEGVLHDPSIGYDKRPDRQDALWLLQLASTMAESALPHLRDTYRNAMNTDDTLTIKPDRIRVNMSDYPRAPLAALIDAMNLSGASFTEARDRTIWLKDDALLNIQYLHNRHESPYREKSERLDKIAKGASEVGSFIQDITGARALSDISPELCKAGRGHYGVIDRHERKMRDDGLQIFVGGLTRNRGHDGGYKGQDESSWRVDHEPKHLRAFSAARIVSAKLAWREAFRFEETLNKERPAPAPVPIPAPA